MRIQVELKSFLKLVVFSAAVSISCVFLTTGCQEEQSKDPLTAEEREWLTKHNGKIVLAHDPNAKPIDYLDEKGEFRGLAADYVHLIEKKLDFKFNIPAIKTWDEVLQKAKKREIDVLCAITKTPEREKWLLFTKPYIIIPTVILVRESIKETLIPEKMKGMKVTFTKGWVIDEYLRKNYGYLDFLPSIDEKTAMNKVSLGQADAWVTALTTSSILIEKHKITNLRVAGEMDLQFKLAIASRKDWPILKQIMQKGLSLISKEERSAIFKKWIHIEGTSHISKELWLGFIIASATILFLIIATLVWNRTLKRQVGQRTEELRSELDERKRAEEKLRESEERYKGLFKRSLEFVYLCDFEGNFIDANDAALEGLGYTKKDIKSLNFMALLDENQLSGAFKVVEEILKTGSQKQVAEFKLRRKDGEHIYVETKGALIYRDEKPFAIQGIARDVTERKQAEQNLLKERTLLKTIIDNIPVMLTHYNPDAHMLYLNKEFEKIVGWKTEEVQDIDMMEKVYPDPDYRQQAMEYMQQASTEWREFRVQSKSGKIIDSEWSNICMEDGTQIGIGIDITERKHAEEVLRESEQKFRLYFDNAPIGYQSLDENGNFIEVNQTWLKMLGYKWEEVIGRWFGDFLHPDMVNLFKTAFPKNKEVRGVIRGVEFMLRCKDGSYVLADYTAIIARDDHGNFVQTHCVFQDITQKRKAEEEIRKLSTAVEQSPSVIAITDLNGNLEYVNPKFTELTGYTSEEAIRENPRILKSGDQPDEIYKPSGCIKN